MNSGMIFDIKRYAINDGPGIRTAVFFKGCPLACLWCHNPEGQATHAQLMFRANRCTASMECVSACPREAIQWSGSSITDWDACDGCGKCAEVCFSAAREMVGKEISTPELMAEIERDLPFYDQSGGGVTFTGGEPMYQPGFLYSLLLACKKQEIHTVVDTSGHAAWESFECILPFVDLFLFDLKHMHEYMHNQYTGVSNRLILNNLHALSSARAHIFVRVPLIPGVNDDDDNLERTAEYLASLPHLDGVEIMPYHEIGIAKYQALGMKYPMQTTKPPTQGQVELAEFVFSSYNLPLKQHDFGRDAWA